MKKVYLLLANLMFIIHIPIFGLILFGWLLPRIYGLYLFTLFISGICYITIGYCPITKWEFYFRKKLDPKLDYDYSFVSYYTRKFAKMNVNLKLVKMLGIVFVWVSLILNIIFHK